MPAIVLGRDGCRPRHKATINQLSTVCALTGSAFSSNRASATTSNICGSKAAYPRAKPSCLAVRHELRRWARTQGSLHPLSSGGIGHENTRNR